MHQRRTGTHGPTVNVDGAMLAKLKKEDFLSNKENKQKFINLLSGKLELSGCTTIHAEGDADLVIVQTAIQSAQPGATVLIGDDTDLLFLLCYHAESLQMSCSSNLNRSKDQQPGGSGISRKPSPCCVWMYAPIFSLYTQFLDATPPRGSTELAKERTGKYPNRHAVP